MTQADQTAAPERKEITWKGRTLHATLPTPEQITVIYRMSRLRPSAEVSAARQLATLNRAPALLAAVITEEEWDEIEDAMISGDVKIEELPDAFAEVITAWFGEGNRSTRRAAAKKTTARRRTP
jgi:hypothetical protein